MFSTSEITLKVWRHLRLEFPLKIFIRGSNFQNEQKVTSLETNYYLHNHIFFNHVCLSQMNTSYWAILVQFGNVIKLARFAPQKYLINIDLLLGI